MSSDPPDTPSWKPPPESKGDDEKPLWDQDEAEGLIGQYALIGFTYVAADGETVTSQVQHHGTIISADPMNGIELRCEGAHAGETIKLPPHLQVFQFANPGSYKLRTTGEVVENPDVMATWSIMAPKVS